MATRCFSTDSQGTLPLVVGVTGHRDLLPQSVRELEKCVRNILTELQTTYSATRIIVLSSLAEGADRLVARIALSLNMELIVPLPMPKEEYEKDFKDEKSRKEFNQLLNQASQPVLMPWVGHNTAENITLPASENRAMQYAAAGAFIVSHCQVMIALWDGMFTGRTGGTGEIIKFMKKGVPYPYAQGVDEMLDAPDRGVIYHVWTPRKKNPNPAKPSATYDLLFPKNVDPKKGKNYYEQIFTQMDTFNRNIKKITQRCPEELEASRKGLISRGKSFSGSYTVEVAEQIRTYSCADVLSQKLQKRYHGAILWILGLTVLSIAISSYFESFGSFVWKSKIAYLLIILIAWITFRVVKNWMRWEERYLDYRAMAEALRVQIFWQLAGIRKNILSYYLPQHRSELDWIRNALRYFTLRKIQAENASPLFQRHLSQAALSFVSEGWVNHQTRYFRRTSHRKQWRSTWFKRISAGLFLLATALTLLIAINDFYTSSNGTNTPRGIKKTILTDHYKKGLFVSSLALAIAGAFSGYQQILAVGEEIRRYKIMRDLFRRSKVQLQHCVDQQPAGKAQGILFALGKNALQENGDWVFIHRGRMKFPS